MHLKLHVGCKCLRHRRPGAGEADLAAQARPHGATGGSCGRRSLGLCAPWLRSHTLHLRPESDARTEDNMHPMMLKQPLADSKPPARAPRRLGLKTTSGQSPPGFGRHAAPQSLATTGACRSSTYTYCSQSCVGPSKGSGSADMTRSPPQLQQPANA